MRERQPSILLFFCDPYLAGIYGRKFEESGWDVAVEETLALAETRAIQMRPDIILFESDCTTSAPQMIRRWRSFPTLQASKIVVVASMGDSKTIHACRLAGALDYLLLGHFVPQEAVEKMRTLCKL